MRIVTTADIPVDLTFVVAAFNEEKYLPYCLGSITEQVTDLVGEIIVVDDSSTDRTAEVSRAYQAQVVPCPEKTNVTKGRNLGLAMARGTAVLFVDADVAFSPDYAETMARPILDGTADVTLSFLHYPLEVLYPVLPEKYSTSFVWALRHFPRWYFAKFPVRWLRWVLNWVRALCREKRWVSILTIPDRVHTSAIMVRTELSRQVGGWVKPLGCHQDTDYCLRVFATQPRVRWITRPRMYLSLRRWFPQDHWWPLRKLIHPIRKLFRLDQKARKKHYDREIGYRDKAGTR